MSLLKEFLAKGTAVNVETVDVKISSISSSREGEFGNYRFVNINGMERIVDEAKIMNIDNFKPGCSASITLKQYEEEGVDKLSLIGLVIA